MQDFSISPLGDNALLVSFSDCIEVATNEKVLQLFYRLKNFAPFIRDVVPAYASLAVYYDVLSLHRKDVSAFERVKELLLPLLNEAKEDSRFPAREMVIPVCYAKNYALDLEELAAQKGLAPEEIIQLHTAITYRVYTIGFLPGFPYMGTVDERIAAPRKSKPRTRIPAGSVGIAGAQTGIYPLSSPGGWNIIGRTPVKLFDKDRHDPVLLQAGDHVRFISISEDEFEN